MHFSLLPPSRDRIALYAQPLLQFLKNTYKSMLLSASIIWTRVPMQLLILLQPTKCINKPIYEALAVRLNFSVYLLSRVSNTILLQSGLLV